MKKVKFINYKNELIEVEPVRVSHYKNYVRIEYYFEYKGHTLLGHEEVKYENIIEESE